MPARAVDQLRKMFKPETVAVIGATNKRNAVGYALMNNLIGSGYEGIVYPVNALRKSILGVRAYASVKAIPDKIDLAVVATPASTVEAITQECGEAGVAAMVIISAGFAESGEEGRAMLARVVAIAKKFGMRILGPNCLGFITPSVKLNASFAQKMALPGKPAFISQSGALCTSILDWAVSSRVGFSHFVSIGSMADVGFHDLIDYFGSDSETHSILIYMESLTNARQFLSAARAFARSKPIIVLKVGRSEAGAAAAMSHTGSMTGNDAVFDAAFKRAGIVRVRTIAELFASAQTLAMQPRPRNNRLAVVTNAGGPGVIATDALIEEGGRLATLSDAVRAKLDAALPPTWSHGNPIDVLGDADPARYKTAVECCLQDPDVDGILVILTPQAMTDSERIARELSSVPNPMNKTILASWMGADDVEKGRQLLTESGIPTFATPESAVSCFMTMYHYSNNLELLYETPESVPAEFVPRTDENRKLLQHVMSEGRTTLTEFEGKQFVANYGIPVGEFRTAATAEEAARVAASIGFPVVMKILSPHIMHKTDVGGVVLNLHSEVAVTKAFEAMVVRAQAAQPEAQIDGVLIEKMVKKRYELLIGSKKDPIFGPVIVFGLGGVAVEVFKDTNIGLPPLNMALSRRLIEDTKVFTLLKGFRGMEGVELDALQFVLHKFAYLLMDFPEIKEIDINPFCVDDAGGVVLDAKVVLDETVLGKTVAPYSHLVISPYPKGYERTCKLRDGREVLLRPIRPEDEPLEEEMFHSLSARTQRFRFFEIIRDISHQMLVRYTQIDYDREIAIIGELVEDGKRKMVGVVRLIADAYNENAEFAVVVADAWQNQGLGNIFTDYLLEIASERKIGMVYATFLKDNRAIKHIFERRGFTIKPQEDVYTAELNLGAAQAAKAALPPAG